MFRYVCLIIAVFWCQLEFVRSADDLKFWVRDPKFDARRALVEDARRNNHTGGKLKTKLKATERLANVTMVNVVATTTSTKATTTQAKTRPQAKNATTTTKKTTVTAKKEELKKNKDFLRSGTARESVYQRGKRYRSSDEQDYTVRSTRMTPLYLMQQPGYDKKRTTPETIKDTDDFLSPYSIRKQLVHIARDFPDANITFETIGRTVEYNDLILMKAAEGIRERGYFRADGSKYVDEVPEKKIVFIVHGLSVKAIRKLRCLYEVDELKKLIGYYFAHLDKFDIYLIPVANPDGVLVTSTIWNKNASPQSACRGVALDRNFDVAWNSSATLSSCSQQYPGSAPFSEPETKAIREIFHRYGHKIIAYINVHAGMYDDVTFKGEAVLYPKGFSDNTSDDDKYVDLRGEIDETMKNASFQVMTVAVETLHSWYGKVAGTSVDYAASIYGIPYALEFAMQLYPDNLGDKALAEVWRRIIDVVFNNIWRNMKNNEV